MKQKHLILSAAMLLSLASCGIANSSAGRSSSSEPSSSIQDCPSCEPCESKACPETPKMKYGHYTLKDSVTDLSEIEGHPWINSDIAGMLGKVEKPEAKHDFYGNANYERFAENPLPKDSKRDGGKIFESSDVTDENVEAIMESDDPEVKAILAMLKEGAADRMRDDVAALLDPNTASSSIRDFASSKALFEGPSRFAFMQVDETGKIHISYALNTDNNTLAIIFFLAQTTQKIEQYTNALIAYLGLLGFSAEEAESLIDTAAITIINAIVALSRASVDQHEMKVGDIGSDFGTIDLKAALLDAGFNADTPLSISDQAWRFLEYLGQADDGSLAALAALSELFDNRFCVGASNFRSLALNEFSGLKGLECKGIKEDSDDDEVAKTLYQSAFPKAFDQLYIAKYIKPSTKDRVDGLINEVIGEYRALFDEEEWLTDATRQAAKEKLDSMWHMSFYSDGFMNEDKRFPFTATDLMGLADDYDSWYVGIMSSCPWAGSIITAGVSTTTVNAMYSPTDNAFAVFHGVCASYIDDNELSTEKLYGYIGTVIGHEISHGFDSNGANYDKNGQKFDWWTAEDKKAFQDKVERIANHFTNGLHGFHDHNYNGPKLTGEVIADMGGVNIMLRLAEKQESFDYDEFFRAFAENFAIQETREYGIERIDADMHPEEYLRVNVSLSQFQRFADTYGIKEGDGMYVAPSDRLAIW